jgi:hypothetical protein
MLKMKKVKGRQTQKHSRAAMKGHSQVRNVAKK